MTLNKYLKEHRLWLNLTLREVEKITGVSNAFICQIETNSRKTPSLKVLKKLSKAYGKETIKRLVLMYLT